MPIITPVDGAVRKGISPWKLLFIGLLVAGGIGMYLFARSRSAAEKGAVLGNTSGKSAVFGIEQLKNDATKLLQNSVKSTSSVVSDTVKQLGDVLGDATSQSIEKAKDAVLDSAYSNAVKQIEKLPPDQQEKIKEHICR